MDFDGLFYYNSSNFMGSTWNRPPPGIFERKSMGLM